MYALNIAENGRILSVTYSKYAFKDNVLIETLPDGNISDYLFIDNAYIYDPIPKNDSNIEQTQGSNLSVYDEFEAAYQEGVNSI